MFSTVLHDTPHAVWHFSSQLAVAGIVVHFVSHEFSQVDLQRQLQPTLFALAEHSAPHEAPQRVSH
jgi:hypothetical protein